MNSKDYLKDLSVRTGIRTVIWILLFVMLLANILLTVTLATRSVEVRQVFLTPGMRNMWVSNTSVSRDYLEEVGTYIAILLMNRTPGNSEVYNSRLLAMTSPEYYSRLDRELRASSIRLKEQNISTWFVPGEKMIEAEKMQITLKGLFNAEQGGRIFQRENKTVVIRFSYDNGLLKLKNFSEQTTQKLPSNELNEKSDASESNSEANTGREM